MQVRRRVNSADIPSAISAPYLMRWKPGAFRATLLFLTTLDVGGDTRHQMSEPLSSYDALRFLRDTAAA